MAKIRAFTDAIDRAKEALAANPSFNAALNIQSLERQRRELRATLPPLALVTN